MSAKQRSHAADLRGIGRLTIEGIVGVVGIVEAMHANVARMPGLRSGTPVARTSGITSLVYRSIHGMVALVGLTLDGLLAALKPLLGERSAWRGREALLACLNGVIGDHLARSDNPLAIDMRFRRGGVALPSDPAALAAALPGATGKVLVLLHGLCLNDLHWKRDGHDHGAALERELGYTAVYLHYNTGLHISSNGRAFAERLEALVSGWPVPVTELVVVGHSMGGLVARSACHYGALARHAWLQHLHAVVFLGTPHHGAPLERIGNWVDGLLEASAYSAPLGRLGRIRSAGITDLRYGNLVDEDWSGHGRFERKGDRRRPVDLPDGVACYVIAATKGRSSRSVGDRLIGDGIVPLPSALGHHADPRLAVAFDASRQYVARRVSHFELLSHPAVYERIRSWLATSASEGRPAPNRSAKRRRAGMQMAPSRG